MTLRYKRDENTGKFSTLKSKVEQELNQSKKEKKPGKSTNIQEQEIEQEIEALQIKLRTEDLKNDALQKELDHKDVKIKYDKHVIWQRWVLELCLIGYLVLSTCFAYNLCCNNPDMSDEKWIALWVTHLGSVLGIIQLMTKNLFPNHRQDKQTKKSKHKPEKNK